MARQPDIQYIQMYNYGSTAPKLAPRSREQKEKYQLPEQRPSGQRARQKFLDPLSVCALIVASIMVVTMLMGLVRVWEVSDRGQELESYIDVLQEQQAGLQKTYEASYDLHQVEQRARQMGLVHADEVYHVAMGDVNPEYQQEPGFREKLEDFFDELFAKAPR